MIIISCLATTIVMVGIALTSPTNLLAGMILLSLGGFTLPLAPLTALGVDLAGRKISGTASGVLERPCVSLRRLTGGRHRVDSGRDGRQLGAGLPAARSLAPALGSGHGDCEGMIDEQADVQGSCAGEKALTCSRKLLQRSTSAAHSPMRRSRSVSHVWHS